MGERRTGRWHVSDYDRVSVMLPSSRPQTGFEQLAVKVLQRALIDAASTTEPHRTTALAFFRCEDSLLPVWCQHLGLDPGIVRTAVLRRLEASMVRPRDLKRLGGRAA